MVFIFAFLFVIVVIIFIIKIGSLSGKVVLMEWELKKLRHEIDYHLAREKKEAPPEKEQEIIQPIPPPTRATVQAVGLKTDKYTEPTGEQPVPILPPQAVPPYQPLSQRKRIEEPSRTKEEWEALIGGKLLNRIGALALIIGVGFFLQYAFENNLISETVRVLIGIASGIGLLIGASRTTKKGFQIFAQGLVGAGIAILYLSIYASFNYYHLVSQTVAFGMMALVTVLTFLQAVKYESIAVSLLGWAGGFLTPFFLSTGSANEIGLFTYIALLDVGILSVVLLRERWIILEPLSLLGTYITYLLWYNKYYPSVDLYSQFQFAHGVPVELIPTAFYLVVFWLIFFGTEFWRNLSNRTASWELRSVVSAFSSCFFYAALYSIVNPYYHQSMGGITFLIGAVYFGTVLLLMKKQNGSVAIPQNIVTAIILLVVATAIQYSGLTLVRYWTVEALALILCARKWNLRYIWGASLILYFITFLAMLIARESLYSTRPQDFVLVVNERAYTYLLFIASTFLAGIFFRDNDEEKTLTVQAAFQYTWAIVIFLLCFLEINDFFEKLRVGASVETSEALNFSEVLTFAEISALYSISFLWIGLKKNIRAIIYCALGGYAIALGTTLIGGIGYVPSSNFMLIFNQRAFTFIIFILSTFIAGIFYRHPDERITHTIRTAFRYSWVIVLFILCLLEMHDFFNKLRMGTTSEIREVLYFREILTFAAISVLYSISFLWFGLKKNLLPLIYCASGAYAVALLMTLIGGTGYVPIDQFILLFNIRAAEFLFMIGGSVVLLNIVQPHTIQHQWLRYIKQGIEIAIVVLIFALLTGETVDYFNKQIHSHRLAEEVERLTNFMQMSLSVVWLIYSIVLLGIGIWKKTRGIRIISIVLFGFTILKIFIYDLSFLQTLYRIFSFIGLGLILLLVSYLYQRYKNLILGTDKEEH